MNCVKCGREIPDDQVFCEACLTEMENYPVKPGTAVHIPARLPEEQPKKTVKRKHIPTAEELLLKTRKKLRRTRILAVILLLICGLLSFLMGQAVLELDFQRILGQNYRTEEGSFFLKPPTEWTQLITELTEPATEEMTTAEENVEEGQGFAPTPELMPTDAPAAAPTEPSTQPPTEAPTEMPTEVATEIPTDAPTEAPTELPTEVPTEASTEAPVEATEAPAEPIVANIDDATEATASA